MDAIRERTARLVELLGHDEGPMGVYYADEKPEGAFGPKPGEIMTREREAAGQIDWRRAFGDTFACFMGKVWLARRKRKAACISHEECGCMGGGFYTGMYRPYLETNIGYVSTGIPGTHIEGEHYLPSPECMRAFMDDTMPPPAPAKYCIVKPVEQFATGEEMLAVAFFARPEVLTGLHSLACYAAGDHNAVASPFSAGCGAIVAWPLVYSQRGQDRAVLGGFDPSARKFYKADELSFAVAMPFYRKMLEAMETSALTRETWKGDLKKVRRSQEAWAKEGKE